MFVGCGAIDDGPPEITVDAQTCFGSFFNFCVEKLETEPIELTKIDTSIGARR